MKGIENFTMPEEIKGLKKKDADSYFRAFLSTAPFLENEVINPVKSALKKKTRYNDSNLPKENVIENSYKIGETIFRVKTIVTNKRPGYASIISNLYDYLYFTEEHARLGINAGTLVHKRKNYVSAFVLSEIFTKIKDRITERGVKQEIYYDKVIDKVPINIAVPRVNYSKLPIEAENLPEIESFYNELIARTLKSFESLAKAGIKKVGWKRIENYLLHVCKIPSVSTEYAKIYDALFFKNTDNSKKKLEEGEIVLIAKKMEDSLPKPVLKTYGILLKKENFISIKGLAKRVEQLIEKNTKDRIPTTKLFFYPFV